MALIFGPYQPGTVVKNPTGSTSSGGSGGRASRVEAPITFEAGELVETGISAEVPITITALKQIQIAWTKFAGALGYRVFVYQKDANGNRINERYRDIGKGDTSLLWRTNEGAQLGGPAVQNVFNVTPIVLCGRNYDINGNPGATNQTFGAYVKYMLKTIGNRTDAQLNLQSFVEFDSRVTDLMKRYFGQQTTIGGGVTEVEATLMAYLKQDEDGKLGLYLLDPFKEPVASFKEIDYVHPPIEGHIQRSATYNKVTMDFNSNPITQALETVPIDVPEADYKFLNNQEFQVSSLLIDRVANASMGRTIAAALKWQMPTLAVPIRAKGFVATIGDIVLISKARGFSKSGTYLNDRWFVIGYARNLEMATVTLFLIKTWPNMDKFKKVAPAATPNWGSASAAEKESYVFIHNSNNLVGGSTFKQSVIGPR